MSSSRQRPDSAAHRPFRCGVASALVLVLLGAAFESQAARRRRGPRRTPRRAAPVAPPQLLLPPGAGPWEQAVGLASAAALAGHRGAVVAMDPRDGRVLALVNPEEAVSRAYQPCSVFKIVVALAGLSAGVVTPDQPLRCQGGCWLWPGHGPIDLRRALAVSCNPYFERVGEQLGYERVQRYAHLLGLGEPSGINVSGETAGHLPASVAPAALGHLSSHAAGIATSPVQLAVLLSAVINGGVVYQPQLAPQAGFVARERWRLPPGTVYAGLAEGFLAAVNEGSASGAFDPEVVVAGKTGTCSRLGWFASYAPADNPQLVLVTLLRPGSGPAASSLSGRIYQTLYKGPAPAAAPRAVQLGR